MTLDQAMTFGIIVLFVWGRLPYDLVALMSLLAGSMTGVVPARSAFEGLGDVVVAAALIVSAAISRSGMVKTLIGTSPNIIISKVRQDVTGHPFRMFDLTPVGLSIAALGMAFLSFAYRLLPGGRKAAAGIDAAFNLDGYVAEARLPGESPLVGKTVAAFETFSDGEVVVAGIVRERFLRFLPTTPARVRRPGRASSRAS